MRNYIIQKDNSGIRLDKYLFKILNNAPSSFVYKMLRKKNIVLNDKKASGKEALSEGDEIKIYLSEETFDKFILGTKITSIDKRYFAPTIIYEDDNLVCAYKPYNMLSQKAKEDDYSFNELLIDYLISSNKEIKGDFKPSVLNRLDRNTEGLIMFAKTYVCANELSRLLKERTIHKYYYCLVKGEVNKELILDGYLSKDSKENKVTVINDSNIGDPIKTRIIPKGSNNNISLLEVELITGKTHQIRAHLASIDHPIIGDMKYGDSYFNKKYKNMFGIDHQLLLSHKVVFPQMNGVLDYLSNKVIEINLPKQYKDLINGNLEKQRS